MTRTRDAAGRETGRDNLRGIGPDETDTFDHEWRSHAERSLLSPLGGAAGSGHVGRLGGGWQ